jgi:hypothetical protein
MKGAGKWLGITAGVGAVWYVAQAVIARFLGVLVFFITAFEASVQEIAEREREIDGLKVEPSLPRRLAADRAYRNSAEAQRMIDLREEINVS